MSALGVMGEAGQAVARVFVDGYGKDLAPLSKNSQAWINALSRAFVTEVMHCALDSDGNVVGIAAASTHETRAMHPRWPDLREHLGLARAVAAWMFMRPVFTKPMKYPSGTGYVECVATAKSHRGQGVATALMAHLETLGFEALMLGVADTNPGAARIYERLGYTEVSRKRALFPKLTGYRWHRYLRKQL